MWTDNPVADFERYDAEQERKLKKKPICCICKEHIQESKAVFFNGKWYCEDDESEFLAIVRKEYLVDTDEEL